MSIESWLFEKLRTRAIDAAHRELAEEEAERRAKQPPLRAVPNQTAGGRDHLVSFYVTLAKPDKTEVVEVKLRRLVRSAVIWETVGSYRMPLQFRPRGPYETIVWPRTDPPAELVVELSSPLLEGVFLINGSVLRIVQKP